MSERQRVIVMMLADLNPAMTMMGVSQVPGHISHGHTVYSNTMTMGHHVDKTVSRVTVTIISDTGAIYSFSRSECRDR